MWYFCCHSCCHWFVSVTFDVAVVGIVVIALYVAVAVAIEFDIAVPVRYFNCRNSFVEILSTFITGNIVASVSGNTVNILTCSPGLILCLFLTRESKNLNKAQATSSRSRWITFLCHKGHTYMSSRWTFLKTKNQKKSSSYSINSRIWLMGQMEIQFQE